MIEVLIRRHFQVCSEGVCIEVMEEASWKILDRPMPLRVPPVRMPTTLAEVLRDSHTV